MTPARRAWCAALAFLTLTLPVVQAQGGQREADDRKPSLSLRANPPVGLSPLRVRTVAEIRGGADDYAEFYCVSVEWDWGDGTVSENAEDCEPYVAGTSEIRRRFSAEHVYRQSGNFRVYIRLKQKNRVVAAANAQLQIRPGARDAF